MPCIPRPFHKRRVVWSSMLFSEPQMVLITGPLKTVLCQLLFAAHFPSPLFEGSSAWEESIYIAYLLVCLLYKCEWMGEGFYYSAFTNPAKCLLNSSTFSGENVLESLSLTPFGPSSPCMSCQKKHGSPRGSPTDLLLHRLPLFFDFRRIYRH